MSKSNKVFKNQIPLSEPIENVMNLMSANLRSGIVGGFLVVVDSEGKVQGTVTDGDLRKNRKAIAHGQIKVAQEIMNKAFVFVEKSHSPLSMAKLVLQQLSKRAIQNEYPIEYIPVLDEQKQLTSILHISSLIPSLERVSRQIIIHGQGFVGLTLAMAMVNSGLRVYAIEKNSVTLQSLLTFKPLVYEPQLEEILINSLNKDYSVTDLDISSLPRESLFCRRIHIVAVGTPMIVRDGNKLADLTDLFAVVSEICRDLKFGDLIVIRSTVPVGTTRRISKFIFERTSLEAGSDYHLAYAPERTVEGNAISEVTRIPQLLGGFTKECERLAGNLFSEFVQSTVLCESLEACELAKLITNSYRDTTFAFANEVALIARSSSIDVNKLILDANLGYSRNAIPMPSPGVGGPCLTKDSYMLGLSDKDNSVIMSSRRLNEKMLDVTSNYIRDILNQYPGMLAVIGVAFKGFPSTNDTRQSPGVEICNLLKKDGSEIWVKDAVVSREEVESLGFSYLKELTSNHSVICLLNNHQQNLNLLTGLLQQSKRGNQARKIAVFDPWNLTTTADSKRYGFDRFTLTTWAN